MNKVLFIRGELITMEEIVLEMVIIILLIIFCTFVFIFFYNDSKSSSDDLVLLAETGEMEKCDDYEVYEFDGRLYAINAKRNIVIPIDEKDKL